MSEGTGRKLFDRYPRAIGAFCATVGALPSGVKRLLWDGSNMFSGRAPALLRYAILKSYVSSIGPNVFVGRNVTIENPRALSIGANVSIHTNCYIDSIGGCTIGDNVSIAHASSILTFEHTWDDTDEPIKYNMVRRAPVSIDDDVWIGCGVRILSGVRIGKRCVVAAGAVVAKDVTTGTLVGGVPAKPIKNITRSATTRANAQTESAE